MHEILKRKLIKARVQVLHQHFFIPEDRLIGLVTFESVREELQRVFPSKPSDKLEKLLAEINVPNSLRLFALLTVVDRVRAISDMLGEKVTDADLPFASPPGVVDFTPTTITRKDGRPLNALSDETNWCPESLESLVQKQWWLLAPVFEDGAFLKLNAGHILPFLDNLSEGRDIMAGGYGNVYGVRIHPAHQKFEGLNDSNDNLPLIAIKQLRSVDENVAKQEITALEQVAKNGHHPQIIKLLACYYHDGSYHLMFPYANGTLRDYWERFPSPPWDRTTVFWMVKQMHTLASGVHFIHNKPKKGKQGNRLLSPNDANLPRIKTVEEFIKYGRHGDIKPENILYFVECGGLTHLKLADLGLCAFHRHGSRSKIDPKTVVTSPTYEPPECRMSNNWISRAFDMWGLGCLLLEFVTWCLDGEEKVKTFSGARLVTGIDGFRDDNFFTLRTERDPITSVNKTTGEVRDKVRHWIEYLYSHKHCSRAIHDILGIVEKDLLLIETYDRLSAEKLELKLGNIAEKAKNDDYLLTGVPLPPTPNSIAIGQYKDPAVDQTPTQTPSLIVSSPSGPSLAAGSIPAELEPISNSNTSLAGLTIAISPPAMENPLENSMVHSSTLYEQISEGISVGRADFEATSQEHLEG